VLSLAGGGSAVLLRPGMVQREDIEAWIGPVGLAGEAAEGESHPAPGMHHKHYSPARTPLFLLPADSPLPEGRGAFLWHSADRPAGAAGRSVRMPREARDYARCIYRTLHDLDREGWDWIAVEPVPDRAEWAAVRDRLSRAATIFSPGTDTRE
jgi:L-threonylcarbamoyladenylate synthase